MGRAFGVEAKRQVASAGEKPRADELGRVRFADVDVVAALRLGRRREDRLRQAIGLAQPWGSRMPHTSPVAT